MHALSHPGPLPRVTGLHLLLLATASSFLLLGRVIPPSLQVDIPGVPPQVLERNGMAFFVPDGTPAISEEEARTVAMTEATTFDLHIKQTVLVRLVDVNAVPPVDQLVWVNTIDLSAQPGAALSRPFGAPGLFPSGNYVPEGVSVESASTPEPLPPHTYHLIFVDANTGEYLYAYTG